MEENLYISNSDKKFNWFYLKVLVFVLALIPFVIVTGKKYAAATTENLVNNYSEARWNEFYSLEKNTVDMLFLGSSHSYCTFDPEIFDTALGTSSYQLGMPLQHMDSTYYTLLEALNYQSPKLVVLEVYWDMLDDEFELTQAGYLFQVLQNPKLEIQYINEVFPLSEKIKYNTNVLRYQGDYFAYQNSEFNKKIESKYEVVTPVKAKQQGTERYRSKGYTYCDYNMLQDEFDKTNQFKALDGKYWGYEQAQINYLIKIVELCKEKNIDLVWVTAPVAPVSMDYIKNYDLIHTSIQLLADKYEIEYYDYNYINKEKQLLTNNNFRDDAHLNHSGVEIVDKDFTEVVARHLKNENIN